MKRLVFVKAWEMAKEWGKMAGKKACTFLRMALKKAWSLVKEEGKKIIYRKSEDNFKNEYIIFGINLTEKLNKKGEKYLQAYTSKGWRRYSIYQIL